MINRANCSVDGLCRQLRHLTTDEVWWENGNRTIMLDFLKTIGGLMA